MIPIELLSVLAKQHPAEGTHRFKIRIHKAHKYRSFKQQSWAMLRGERIYHTGEADGKANRCLVNEIFLGRPEFCRSLRYLEEGAS